jgi:uncharacterized membrane protein
VQERDLGRIMAFTDGVMAVAITLLVLNLEVPRVPGGELSEALVDLVPSVIAYLLAFALVGRYWILHHRLFEALRGFDSLVMMLNLVFLALIVLMPFATEVFDRYTDEPVASATLGAILGLAALAHWVLAVHALRSGFVHEERRAAAQPSASPIALTFTFVFLLSVPVAYLSPLAATLLWVSTLFLHRPVRRFAGATEL